MRSADDCLPVSWSMSGTTPNCPTTSRDWVGTAHRRTRRSRPAVAAIRRDLAPREPHPALQIAVPGPPRRRAGRRRICARRPALRREARVLCRVVGDKGGRCGGDGRNGGFGLGVFRCQAMTFEGLHARSQLGCLWLEFYRRQWRGKLLSMIWVTEPVGRTCVVHRSFSRMPLVCNEVRGFFFNETER